MRFAALLILLAILATSCEKDVNIRPGSSPTQLVVEGRIEQGSFPVIALTHSLQYFTTIDPLVLQNSFVHGASITITDNGQAYPLKEYRLDTLGVASIYYYTIDSTRRPWPAWGQPGHTYALQMEVGGKTYESTTTIPKNRMVVDSVWYKRVLYDGDSSYTELRVRITDPAESGNFARYFTKRNSEPYYAGLNSTQNDELMNGLTFNITLDRGVNRNEKLDLATYAYFRVNDTVRLKFCNIDKPTYDFWRTLDFAYSSNGNPFGSPVVIEGNVPGAQGYWGGYSVQYASIIMRD